MRPAHPSQGPNHCPAGPSLDAEVILVMPAGSIVTLTYEGYQNGFVTVDDDGRRGWAYADVLAEPGATA